MIKKILIIVSFIAIFILAILVWYSPVLFKGYTLDTNSSNVLIKARNYAQTGIYSSEDNLSVILSPELIPERGQESFYGSKLSGILYSYIIRFANIFSNPMVVLTNCIILALALLFFSLTVYYLFNFKILIFFSLIYIFLPSNWLLPQTSIAYTFALLFLSLFFLFFCLGTQKFTKDKSIIKSFKFSTHGIYLILSGIFLSLGCLAKETIFLILPILFIFLLILKLKKYIYYIFIPLIILTAIFWLPDFISQKSGYSVFFVKSNTEIAPLDLSSHSHLFPDPYTYHFNKEEFLKEKFNNLSEGDLITQIGAEKALVNRGELSINLWQRIKSGTTWLVRHIFRFFSITEIGGPFIFFLFFLGLCVLKKQKKYWFNFYLAWFIGGILLMSYIVLVNRNHLMDFGWAIAVSVAWGIILLADILTRLFNNKKLLIEILLLILTLYNLVLCAHVMWGQVYDKSPIPFLNAYANEIENYNINDSDIIAVPFNASEACNFNFITNKSIVIFKPETIEKLLTEKKLQDAFNKFNVKYILGYSPELSQEIINQTKVKLIVDSSLPIEQENIELNIKNWFMNLIK